MSSITVVKRDITKMNVDCIVNAANSGLQAGGGVCGAIFAAAGYRRLQKACDEIGGCPTGSAVITPGFDLKAKYIIHAVGPVWQGGNNGEPEALYNCYRKSLQLAEENGCTSIAFPLISSGIYGYPKEEAWEKAIQSCSDYMDLYQDHDIDVYFAVIDDIAKALGERVIDEMLGDDEEEEVETELIQAPFDDERNPYNGGAPVVEEALRNWNESDNEEDLDELLGIIVQEAKEGLKVIVPVAYDEEGDVMYQMLSDDDDDNWMTCFTNKQEKNKGESSSSVVMTMAEAMETAMKLDKCDGLAINPWGDSVLLPNELMQAMREDMEPKTEDQLDFEAGMEAYAACDHDAAFSLFEKAAQAGNIAAMGRLGTCYYHGLGTEKDAAKAIECWEKAAIFGDPYATLNLGDMYRTGQKDLDVDFAMGLYNKAFVDSCADPNAWIFPDAALRVLRYLRDGFDQESLQSMASDMVECYNKRIQMGDKTCGAELAEAESILRELE